MTHPPTSQPTTPPPPRNALARLYSFSRPHTVIATSVQVITLFVITGGWRTLNLATTAIFALTWVSCLAANIYVVGLNQLADIAIDRINKPDLPLAAGDMSPRAGRIITTVCALLSLGLGVIGGAYLLLTVSFVMLIGTIYSLPPLHLKRSAGWAALSIAFARGFLANIGIGLHYHSVFGGPLPVLMLAVVGTFFFGFGLVIAIYKDIPDLEGDRAHQIRTFTVRLGPKRAMALGRGLLTLCYGLPIALATVNLPSAAAIFLLLTQVVIITLFWRKSMHVDPARQASMTSLYMFLWGMFYIEFVVLSVYEIARTLA